MDIPDFGLLGDEPDVAGNLNCGDILLFGDELESLGEGVSPRLSNLSADVLTLLLPILLCGLTEPLGLTDPPFCPGVGLVKPGLPTSNLLSCLIDGDALLGLGIAEMGVLFGEESLV